MGTVTCPIDQQPCEGACGPVNSDRCQESCAAGKNWMDHRTNRLMKKSVTNDNLAPVKAKHGARTWAVKLKCGCNLCVIYNEERYKKDQKKRKARRTNGKEHKGKHGTLYAWNERKCDCPTCLDHKVKYLRNKYEKERLKRQRQVT